VQKDEQDEDCADDDLDYDCCEIKWVHNGTL
jgi:hypothetical protein